MTIWREWSSYRRFRKVPPPERNIVFYSETHQDWHHLQPLSDFLTERLARTVCHVTSEPTVALPSAPSGRLHAFRVGAGAVCTWLFQTLKADVMILTMLDLGNFQLKRSLYPVHYVYVFHSMGSTHMVDHENSYDHYDSLLCAGPHHVEEIRRGEQSTLPVCGEPLIAALLGAGIRVILRPHYQTARLAPRLVERLVAQFGPDPRFRHVDRMEESASLLESDLLISDWSAMAIEYALGLGKPVLFVDVPPRVRNPRYAELGLKPM